MKKLLLIASLCLLLVPALTFASIDNNLYYGLQKNSDVKQLQEFLIDKGFLTGSSTGNFFSLTLNAVKAYQKSIKVSQSGYVGLLTRASINSDLATQLSASNAEATTEAGTIPPTPTPPATTTDIVASLKAQIALLMQQVQAMQAQETATQQTNQQVQQLQQTVQQQSQTIQQIQQNTQQIAQNTTFQNNNPTYSKLSVSCYVGDANLFTGQSSTFTSSVGGGNGVYTYSWSGDCISSDKNCTTTFNDIGNKKVKLTVISGDGQTSDYQCSKDVLASGDYINKLTNSYKDFSVQFTLDKTQVIGDGKDLVNMIIKTMTKDGSAVQPYTSLNFCGLNVADGSIISNGWNCNVSGNTTGADGTWNLSLTAPLNISVSPFKIRVILKTNPTQYYDSPAITVVNP